MIKAKGKTKYMIMSLWFLLFSASFYVYYFDSDFVKREFLNLTGSSFLLAYGIYLLVSCLRGFTLIPVTYFIVIGVFILPPWPLYILTMIGVMVSSSFVYYFSEYMNFDEYFENKHPKQIKKIKEVLSKNELIIVTSWSFFPFLPTDLMCYVCGSLEVPIKKFLFAVFMGEGVAAALYIFLGKELLGFIGL